MLISGHVRVLFKAFLTPFKGRLGLDLIP